MDNQLVDAAQIDTSAAAGGRAGGRVFSSRLESFLDQLSEGETPNAGRFCSFCYNPLPFSFQRCDHCGQDVAGRKPLASLPVEVLQMHARLRRRESIIVNSFAYLGLALGLALFLGLVAVNVLLLDRELWFFILATLVFLVGSRVLAGLLGGVLGDELAFRYARKRLAQDWTAHLTRRESEKRR